MTTPDPDSDRTPNLPGGFVPPGETPPAAGQATEGLAHREEPPANAISWGFVIAILVIVLLIGGGAIAAAISYL